MSKKGTTLPQRLLMMVERCGSRRALSRLTGISDMTIRLWEQGATPLASKLRRASEKSKISLEWLAEGKGDAEAELAKCNPVTVQGQSASRAVLDRASLQDAVRFIANHGDPGDVKMVEQILLAARAQIEARKASGKHLEQP